MNQPKQFQRQRQRQQVSFSLFKYVGYIEYVFLFYIMHNAQIAQKLKNVNHFTFMLLQIIGPKTILIYRNSEHGFGFTLRHFIVYPPDSQDVSSN